ncbi:MAG: M10 family metallopeptidase C-terminal domain-containing protein [Beijerinckiaceae bacterium]
MNASSNEGIVMCILCQIQQNQGFSQFTDPQFAAGTGTGRAQYGAGSVGTATASNVANTDALISGYKWAGSNLTFALPAISALYSGYMPSTDETGSFAAVTGQLATGIRTAMAHISAYTGLTITETRNAGTANMLLGRTGDTGTAHAYYPDGYFKGGDVWFGLSADLNAPAVGNYAYMTALHEIGHALGLKHAHTFIGGVNIYEDDSGVTNAPVAANRDSLEFTVMTYRSHIGQDLAVFDYYTNEDASFPQTLMMYDIAALQQMYGADFTTNATDSNYTFNIVNGEMSINGVSEGALAGNRVFRTVWDGGGVDTYDFSNYSANQSIDLTPGNWSLFSTLQRADLGSGNYARGNVFNALQFGDDLRSLIEHAKGGAGNDAIIGNQTANALYGNQGDDAIEGRSGNDYLEGGFGNDTLDGGADNDILSGGAGNDTFFVDSNLDLIYEIAGEGTDTVNTTAAFTQLDAANTLENMTYTGTASGTLYGNALGNVLTGGINSDNLNGFFGVDILYGGDGNDFLYIDEQDFMNGGAGYDAVYIQTIVGTVLNVGLSQVEFVVGYTGNDVLNGSTSTVTVALLGGGGADVLRGGSANDYLYIDSLDTVVDAGGGNNDVIVVYNDNNGVTLDITAANAEYVIGGNGGDILNAAGSAIAVSIQGGAGADTITGGNASDYLYGDAGADIFRVTVNAQTDAVLDFVDAGGAADDRINVSALGTNFDTIAEILAATTETSGTSVIDFGGSNQLYLFQIAKTSLTVDDFIFV